MLYISIVGHILIGINNSDKIKNGATIRLQHLNTKKNLHSHLHPSPLTNQQEVSAYGDNGVGDTGDDWKVEVTTGTHWKRDEVVKFKHADTGKYLQSNRNQYRNPIPGTSHSIKWYSRVCLTNLMLDQVNKKLLARLPRIIWLNGLLTKEFTSPPTFQTNKRYINKFISIIVKDLVFVSLGDLFFVFRDS